MGKLVFLDDLGLDPRNVAEIRETVNMFDHRLPPVRRLNDDFRKFADDAFASLVDLFYLPLFALTALNGKSLPALMILLEKFGSGALRPGMTLVGESSGNTAVGWAYFSRLFGIKFVAVVKKTVPMGKRKQIEWAGGEVRVVPDGMTPEVYVDELAGQPQWVKCDQYTDWASVRAHQVWTMPHIRREASRLEVTPSAMFIPLGTTSTFVAAADLRLEWRNLRLVGVACAEGEEVPGARTMERLKQTGFDFEGVSPDLPPVLMGSAESSDMSKELVRYEVTAGPTCGMALAASFKTLNGFYAKGGMDLVRPFMNTEGRIALFFVFMDTHLVYLSEGD